jgi:hypothetical protein
MLVNAVCIYEEEFEDTKEVIRICKSKKDNRNGSGRFGAVKSDSTHHFFGNTCTKSGPLRFLSFPVVD